MEPSKRDSVFEAMSHRYRRQLLITLLNHNQQDELEPLNIVFDGIESEALETKLYHSHLPKLEQMEYISWDRNSNKISKGSDWGEIEPLLTLINEHQDELSGDWLQTLSGSTE